jgi:hypothetical protein
MIGFDARAARVEHPRNLGVAINRFDRGKRGRGHVAAAKENLAWHQIDITTANITIGSFSAVTT